MEKQPNLTAMKKYRGSKMKQLLENWREYKLNEEIESQKLHNWGDWVTVDHLTQIIRSSREGDEPSSAKKWLAKELGLEFIKSFTPIGNIATAAGFLADTFNKFKRKPEGVEGAKEFPILDKLDVDPYLMATIDNDIMNEMDEEYEKYLTSLPGDTLVKNITDVNDYIRGIIATDTNNHVVIKDLSKNKKNEEKRIPRKKGQPAKSDKHSDLYTDEDPKGTIHGLGYKDEATARASVSKIKKSGRSHAHKTQAAIAMEQRAKAAGKSKEAAIFRKFIEQQKKKTKQKNKKKVKEGFAAYVPGSSEYKLNKALKAASQEMMDPKHKTTWQKISLELRETKEAWNMFTRWAGGEKLSSFEKEFLWDQIKDVMKGTALGAILAAPIGGAFWLPIALRMLDKVGIQAYPSSFSEGWEKFLAENKK